MFWTNTDIQDFLLDAETFTMIKNYQLNVFFKQEYKEKKFLKTIKEEFPFLQIQIKEDENYKKIILTNQAAKEEGEQAINLLNEEIKDIATIDIEENKPLFDKIIDYLIDINLMEKYEKELTKFKKDSERIFEEHITEEIEKWQIEYIKILKHMVINNDVKDFQLNKWINQILRENKNNKKEERNEEINFLEIDNNSSSKSFNPFENINNEEVSETIEESTNDQETDSNGLKIFSF